ncbi:hypothetical protein TSOC_006413, partial [Tetrabaena socialis]
AALGFAADDPGPTFLIPLLWNGPNNQVSAIKETLALAHLLAGGTGGGGAAFTTVLPDLLAHEFTDDGKHPNQPMVFEELFDREALRAGGVDHVLLRELRTSGGWGGNLSAVVCFRDYHWPPIRRMATLLGLTAPAEDAWLRSPASSTRGCSDAAVEQLRRLVQPFKFVGIVTFNDFTYPTSVLAGTLLLDCGGDACCQAYKEGSPSLRMSPQLLQLADGFVRAHAGGEQGRGFVASHIRPYPDLCVELWRLPKEELSYREVRRACMNDYLYEGLLPGLQALLHRFNTSSLFVMAHPAVRPRVFRMLEAANIRPVVMGMHHLEGVASPLVAASDRPNGTAERIRAVAAAPPGLLRSPASFSLLAMVEEAVAVAAAAFLGTAESSMTGAIMQERLAQGLAPASNFYFAPQSACRATPCPLPHFYEADVWRQWLTLKTKRMETRRKRDEASGKIDPRDGEGPGEAVEEAKEAGAADDAEGAEAAAEEVEVVEDAAVAAAAEEEAAAAEDMEEAEATAEEAAEAAKDTEEAEPTAEEAEGAEAAEDAAGADAAAEMAEASEEEEDAEAAEEGGAK